MTRHAAAAQLGLELPEPLPMQERSGVLRSLHLSGAVHVGVAEALERDKKAGRQEKELLDFIRGRWPREAFTPSEVHAELQRKNDVLGLRTPPITSIRRTLTNATHRNELRHWPQERRPGPWGVDESCWSVAEYGREG